MHKRSISIIIVTFNSEKYIERCLSSILNSVPDDIAIKIIVIDNNSIDSSVSRIKKLAHLDHRIILFQNHKNLGFSRAVNMGILFDKQSDYVLLLNPDTISNEQTIKNLLSCATENEAGIIGGSTYDDKGNQNGSYFRIPNIFVGIFDFTNFRKLINNEYWHNYFYYIGTEITKKSCFPVDVVTGGFMLISRNTIDKIGLFDQRFFMYLEDVDYCLRAKKLGIRVFHSNRSKIIHFAGRSSNNKDRIRHSSWLISRKLYYLKNFGILQNMIIQPIFLVDDLFILIKKFFSK